MNKVLGFFKSGDRATLNYSKGGSINTLIVQILEKNQDNELWYIVRAPMQLLENIDNILLLDREKYNISEKWGVIKVSPMVLTPCMKPKLSTI